MNQYKRNVAVGLTVLISLGLMAGMIVLFTGLPEVFQRGYVLHMHFPATGNAQKSDLVHLSGIRVGRITDIAFTDPNDPSRGVTITARIDGDVRIPGSAVAYVTKSMVGPSYVELKPDGPPRYDPRTGRLWRFLPADGPVTVEGFVRGGDAIQQLRPAMESLAKVAESVSSLINPPESLSTAPATQMAPRREGLSETVVKLNRTLDALEALVGDEKMRTELKTATANLAEATEKAKDVMDALKTFATEASKTASSADAKLEEVTGKLIDVAEKISSLMTTINQIVIKTESGEGTAGMMLNDPALYNNLEKATAELTRLLSNFDALVNEWRERGFKLR
ncbi:MAG: MCE family protein [Phycisphaerae bacterium]|nr:MCE family protein [Phycisphaerae bacterium]